MPPSAPDLSSSQVKSDAANTAAGAPVEATISNTKPRVLFVEASSTLRYVLQKYIEDDEAQEIALETVETYQAATEALNRQFDTFNTESDFDYLLLGWPADRDSESTRLLALLEGVDFADLSVIVLSQDMRPDARAWVAARERCLMVKWKDYKTVSELIQPATAFAAAPAVATGVDHSDIRVLCVDDSASIRYALQDLMQLQGFDVVAAGSFVEALEAVQQQHFDIALIDYYLQDGTGDELCKSLLAEADNELICTILTSTYSDHVVKRSLLAGATECLFKNESSDLLLARLSALSGLIRQRRARQTQLQKLESVVDSVAGSILVFDAFGEITFANSSACHTLGHADCSTLVGYPVTDMVNAELPAVDRDRRIRGRFATAGVLPVDVLFRCSAVERDGQLIETIVVFRTLEQIATQNGEPEQDPVTRFLKVLSENRATSRNSVSLVQNSEPESSMLLMLDIGYTDADNHFHSIAESESAVADMLGGLQQVYRRRNHVVHLEENRFAVLLRQATEDQIYLQARKIMQLVNEIGQQQDLGEFSVNGSLLSVDKNTELDEIELIQRTRQGLKLVESKGRNNALLLDLKRVLPVYPETLDTEL